MKHAATLALLLTLATSVSAEPAGSPAAPADPTSAPAQDPAAPPTPAQFLIKIGPDDMYTYNGATMSMGQLCHALDADLAAHPDVHDVVMSGRAEPSIFEILGLGALMVKYKLVMHYDSKPASMTGATGEDPCKGLP
jgi:hypothetical protein